MNGIKKSIYNVFYKTSGVCFILFCTMDFLYSQEKNDVVSALVNAGYENVSREVGDMEEIIMLENSLWRANGEGIREAIKIIELFPLTPGMERRVVVLRNKVPQLSLLLHPGESTSGITDWKVSYELGDSWKKISEKEFANNSRWKADLVFYPQVSLRNQKFHKIYDVLINVAPALEISPFRGTKITGQIIIPIFNEFGGLYDDVRPGYITVQQNFRVENVFLQATVGNFNQNRWGMDLSFFRPFTKGWLQHFAVKGGVGLTGSSYFVNWNWHYGPTKLCTWNVGGSYYNPQYNVLCEVRVERFLAGDIGVRADMTRHFRRTSIGFYIMKNDYDNLDGGFHFSILIPPMKYKRKRVRVTPAKYFNMEYKAAGLFYNGKSYKTNPGQNKAEENFNPYYIKSQLQSN